jgi:hypothetical protein
MMKLPHFLTKTGVLLLLTAGLAACTGATEPAESTPLPVETEEVQPELATETVPSAPTKEMPPTQSAEVPPTQSAEVPPTTDTPPGPTPLPAVILPDLGLAPDFTNEVWLNTEGPLNLETLRGKVVLVEFWTFG